MHGREVHNLQTALGHSKSEGRQVASELETGRVGGRLGALEGEEVEHNGKREKNNRDPSCSRQLVSTIT